MQTVPHVQATHHTADATSPIYKLSVPFFDKGTPKEWIKFRHGLQAVLKGQNATQGPPSYAVVKTLLEGDALTMTWQHMYIQRKPGRPKSATCRGTYVLAEELL
eukprot:487243-Ditylum_brightwellii.AAC.1